MEQLAVRLLRVDEYLANDAAVLGEVGGAAEASEGALVDFKAFQRRYPALRLPRLHRS